VAVLRRWAFACAIAAAAAAVPAAGAATLQTLDGALAQAFPAARIERRTLALSPADVKAV